MNKKVYRQSLAAGIVVLAISATAFILTFEMPGLEAIFPRIASSILFLLGSALAVTNGLYLLRDAPTNEAPVVFSQFYNPALTLIIIIAYALGIKMLGFYVSTVMMMFVFMYFMGIDSIKTILFTTGVVTLLVYFVFSMQLRVPLPKGFLL